jgi:hypothetical protein
MLRRMPTPRLEEHPRLEITTSGSTSGPCATILSRPLANGVDDQDFESSSSERTDPLTARPNQGVGWRARGGWRTSDLPDSAVDGKFGAVDVA